MAKPLHRYQVRVVSPRGSYQMMTSAKSAAQAVNFVRFRLRDRGVFVDKDDCTVEEVA